MLSPVGFPPSPTSYSVTTISEQATNKTNALMALSSKESSAALEERCYERAGCRRRPAGLHRLNMRLIPGASPCSLLWQCLPSPCCRALCEVGCGAGAKVPLCTNPAIKVSPSLRYFPFTCSGRAAWLDNLLFG